jgi:glutaminyl-peptide cyclotransferase
MRMTSFILLLATSLAVPFASACDALPWRGQKTEFNGQAALAYAKAQVDFGPRVPGSVAAKRAGDWIIAEMRKRADTVIVQSWTHVTRQGDTLPLRNIFAQFRPAATERVLYLTHWDTRPVADEDMNLGKRRLPFDGANDGASGVGLLMALADVLKKTPASVGVDLLFVDGEDWGSFDGYPESAPDVLIGSTYFAKNLPSKGYKPMYGVLWDMIGDAQLNIYQEGHSLNAAPEVVQRVWETARQLGYAKNFIPRQGDTITDDHVPLINIAGFRVIDVIDIEYVTTSGPTNYHHTSLDTMDKISAQSLQIVGDVALTLLR